MNLNTYESASIRDVFVTIPSAEARATIEAVDKLRALRLRVVKARYSPQPDGGNAAFFEFVGTEIAATGYALHGFNVAFEQ